MLKLIFKYGYGGMAVSICFECAGLSIKSTTEECGGFVVENDGGSDFDNNDRIVNGDSEIDGSLEKVETFCCSGAGWLGCANIVEGTTEGNWLNIANVVGCWARTGSNVDDDDKFGNADGNEDNDKKFGGDGKICRSVSDAFLFDPGSVPVGFVALGLLKPTWQSIFPAGKSLSSISEYAWLMYFIETRRFLTCNTISAKSKTIILVENVFAYVIQKKQLTHVVTLMTIVSHNIFIIISSYDCVH